MENPFKENCHQEAYPVIVKSDSEGVLLLE